ncbi:LysR family transcriptional regulator [Sansalvadorimonas verongulae]|uniref:LysR family transcriptional regulator n=1 Tax=Sansalvadorimonas verongulae TaxID=2172824 RepID=UPI0012BC51CA|nr:LysR family transcriptional regulator [Sansalvadorimonas verongulae]MTI14237.1 LysR family transcriptional regulator [Sansalvadorimonas verongulae]
MDLQQIKYFLAVVDSGTFLAASKRVFVSQPTLSAGIRKLEESLDTTLFHRGSRSATLTQAGERFLVPARQAYNQLQAIKSQLSEQPEKIVVGVLKNIHMDYVADIIRTYRASHPHILIEVVEAGSEDLLNLYKKKKVDVIVVNSLLAADNFTPLIDEQLCLVVPKVHAFAGAESIELSVLNDELFIERTGCSFWQEVNDLFQKHDIRPRTVMQTASDEFVLSLVAANLGTSVMTYRETPYDVSFIPLTDFSLDRTIGICAAPAPEQGYLKDFCHLVAGRYSRRI